MLADLLRKSADVSEEDVELLTPQARGLGTEVVLPAVLIVASTALTTVTKSWVEKYLWPELSRRLDKPSKRFVDWLLDTILPESAE